MDKENLSRNVSLLLHKKKPMSSFQSPATVLKEVSELSFRDLNRRGMTRQVSRSFMSPMTTKRTKSSLNRPDRSGMMT